MIQPIKMKLKDFKKCAKDNYGIKVKTKTLSNFVVATLIAKDGTELNAGFTCTDEFYKKFLPQENTQTI